MSYVTPKHEYDDAYKWCPRADEKGTKFPFISEKIFCIMLAKPVSSDQGLEFF